MRFLSGLCLGLALFARGAPPAIADDAVPKAEIIADGRGFKQICSGNLNVGAVPNMASFGPVFYFRSDGRKIEFSNQKTFNLVTLNAWEMDNRSSRSKLKKIAQLMQTVDAGNFPDIIALQEVGSAQILRQLAEAILPGEYFSIFVRGNREIANHLGFLIKRTVKLNFEVRSHRDILVRLGANQRSSHLFGRDFPVLIFYETEDLERRQPKFFVANTHLKSSRVREVVGSELLESTRGFTDQLWGEQLKMMANLTTLLRSKIKKRTPFFVMGDFNQELNQRSLFSDLYGIDFINSLEAGRTPVPIAARATYLKFLDDEVSMQTSQSDGILLSAEAGSNLILESKVHFGLDDHGVPLRIFKSLQDRNEAAVDHGAVFAQVDLKKLRSP